MAFGSISKYTKIVQEKGITQKSVAEKSTKATVDTEKAASIFNEDGSGKTSVDLSSPVQTTVSESYDTSAMEKAVNKYTKALKLQTALTSIASLGNLFGAASSVPSYNYVSSNTNVKADTTSQANDLNLQMGISNTLETAIQNYSKNNKSADTWTNLVSQTSAAKADLLSIASFKQEQQAIITAFPEKLQALQTEVENLKQEKIEAGKAVDANREGIQLNIRKNAIETKEIPAQEKAISDSQTKVSNAEKKLTEDLAGQDGIIKEATPDLKAVKLIKNADGTTEQIPDTAKRNAAQAKIDAANKKKEELQAAFDKLKATEEKVQSDAQAKLNDLTSESHLIEEKLQNCGKTQEELEQVQKRYADAIDNLNKKNDEIDKLKEEKATAQSNLSTAASREKSINKLIEKADQLMVDKK